MPLRLPSRPLKYRNTPVMVDGERFDSKAEARRFVELKLLEKAGQVRSIRRQVVYPLIVGATSVSKYVADFVYEEAFDIVPRHSCEPYDWREVIEDVKSEPTRKTRLYRLKAKWMTALGRPIREVTRSCR